MTQDGGLERLVRMLHDYCISPTPPENPALIYGLTPPNSRPQKPVPTLNPQSFDKHAAYRFSLAFQCVVNIGVRGSEHIRSRVVQAGTLDVVGCVLEAWLASKGFAVGPSSSATGLPRESREQRQARRAAQVEARQREEAAQLQRALQQTQQRLMRHDNRTLRPRDDDAMDTSPSPSPSTSSLIDRSSHNSTPGANSDTDMSTDASMTTTPLGSGTPTGSVVIPNRDRSGTVVGYRPPPQDAPSVPVDFSTHRSRPQRNNTSSGPSTDTSRAETETEDGSEPDVDMHTNPSPERHHRNIARIPMNRRPVGIVSNDLPAVPQTGGLGLNADAHIIINQAGGPVDGGVSVGVVDGEVGVEDGLVSLEANDDFAMGAPPGAPGAINDGTTPHPLILGPPDAGRRRNTDAPDVTPRAGFIGLPGSAESTTTLRGNHSQPPASTTMASPISHQRTIRARHNDHATHPNSLGPRQNSTSHYREIDTGPYRDEDVLLGLQLLAYLSKYPHVRQAFYKPRVTFHPASVSSNPSGARFVSSPTGTTMPSAREKEKQKESAAASSNKDSQGFFRTLTQAATGSRGGKERSSAAHSHSQTSVINAPSSSQIRQTNVFSLVERFTFKPSSTETELPNPPPRLPPEIQYWAGVIMRNACRKDDSRGGIRQCANMLCGRWESYPREFAKCRRCRKAKYCGKECQSTAWSEGHRFWCSAKDADDEDHVANIPINGGDTSSSSISMQVGSSPSSSRAERRERDRERERVARERGESDTATVRGGLRSAATPSASASRADALIRDRTLQPTRDSRAYRASRASAFVYQEPPPGTTTTTTISSASGIRRRGETITPATAGTASSSTEGSQTATIPSRVLEDRDPLEGPSRRGVASYHRFSRTATHDGEGDDMVLG